MKTCLYNPALEEIKIGIPVPADPLQVLLNDLHNRVARLEYEVKELKTKNAKF